jgi:hypothetical protein
MRGYFLDRLLAIGLSYRPVPFGPLSAKLDHAIGTAKALGFLVESTGPVRRDELHYLLESVYSLSDDGREALEALRSAFTRLSTEIQHNLVLLQNAVGDDHIRLDAATKVDMIRNGLGGKAGLDLKSSPETGQWQPSMPILKGGVEVLQALGLLSSAASSDILALARG